MRSLEDVRQRIRGLLTQELDRRIALARNRLPHRCVHNHRHTLDTRKAVDGEVNESFNRITARSLPVASTIGLCMLNAASPEEWGGTICEDPIDAQKCPVFTPRQSQEALFLEFQEQLATEGWIEEQLPDVAALLWVLADGKTEFVTIPWWKALWYRWILRIRIEPVVTLSDSSHLLEPPHESNRP